MNKQRGFTIIELIVVIAIIAVLAAIVLVNVTQYINKGKDASIKGNMSTIITNSAVYFDTCGLYTATPASAIASCQTAFTASTNYTVPAAAITSAGKTVTPVVKSDGSVLCACATMYDTTNGTYCVDTSGYKKQTNTACTSRCVAGVGATALCAD